MRKILREERERQGYTQQNIADIIGISRSNYTKIETGVNDPSYKIAVRIKRLLGHPSDDIFFNEIVTKSNIKKKTK